MELFPLFTQASTSDNLNFQSLPILWAGMFVFLIQFRIVSVETPKYSDNSFIPIQRSIVFESIKSTSHDNNHA